MPNKVTVSQKIAKMTKDDIKKLKDSVAILNGVEGVIKTISLVGIEDVTKRRVIIDGLTDAVEDFNVREVSMPEGPVEFFNWFWTGTKSDPKPAGAKKPEEKKKVAASKKKEKAPPKEKATPKAQLRAEFLHKLIKKKALPKKEIMEQLQITFGDSVSEARYQTSIALFLLTVFGAVVEKDGKFKVA